MSDKTGIEQSNSLTELESFWYRKAGPLGTCKAIWDSVQNMLCVGSLRNLLNSVASLRLCTSTRSHIKVAVHESYSAVNTQNDQNRPK